MKKVNSQSNGRGVVWSGLLKALRIPISRQDMARTIVREYLEETPFPASKQDLLEAAAKNQAPEKLILGLRQLADRKYETLDDVATNLDPHYIR